MTYSNAGPGMFPAAERDIRREGLNLGLASRAWSGAPRAPPPPADRPGQSGRLAVALNERRTRSYVHYKAEGGVNGIAEP